MKDLINRLREPWRMPEKKPPVMDEAADALKAQQAEIEALIEDKARLDWLEANPRHAQIMVDGVATDCVFYGISCAQLMKLREAIDAARRK